MDKHEIEAYLMELDEALAQAFPHPEPIRVLVVGGACLLLADVTMRTTNDIDVIISPSVRPLASAMGIEASPCLG